MLKIVSLKLIFVLNICICFIVKKIAVKNCFLFFLIPLQITYKENQNCNFWVFKKMYSEISGI